MTIEKLNVKDEYELFVFDGKVARPSSLMPSNDPRFAPDSIIERGAESIRRYWNMKNLRRRKK